MLRYILTLNLGILTKNTFFELRSWKGQSPFKTNQTMSVWDYINLNFLSIFVVRISAFFVIDIPPVQNIHDILHESWVNWRHIIVSYNVGVKNIRRFVLYKVFDLSRHLGRLFVVLKFNALYFEDVRLIILLWLFKFRQNKTYMFFATSKALLTSNFKAITSDFTILMHL